MRLTLALAVLMFALPCAADELGLDLTETADVQKVLVIPPVVKVQASPGAFAGMGAGKTIDKFDVPSLKSLVGQLMIDLGNSKVVTVEATLAALSKPGVKPATARTPAVIAQLASATSAQSVIVFDVEKTDLFASIFDSRGTALGKRLTFAQAALLSQSNLTYVGSGVAAALVASTKPSEPVAAVAPPPAAVDPTPTPDVPAVDTEATEVKKAAPPEAPVAPAEVKLQRAIAAVGGGYALRSFFSSGDNAPTIGGLQNTGAGGFAVYAHVAPLQFIGSLANSRWADVHVDLNYRRGFLSGTSSQGTPCTATDDDLQTRLGYRVAVGGARAPSLGLGLGWSQERTSFNCSDPLINTVYRGVDLQLKVRQPIVLNVLAVELAVGPRFLIPPTGATAGFSLSGEAWLTATPVSVLFIRGGARFLRAQLSSSALALNVNDLRVFAAVEIGAFL